METKGDQGSEPLTAGDYTTEALLEVLLGEDAAALDALVAACREDPALADAVRRLARLDALLGTSGDAQTSVRPSPELLARYLHDPQSLEPGERNHVRVHLALDPETRREVEAMQRFSGGELRLPEPVVATPEPARPARAVRPDATQRAPKLVLATGLLLVLGLSAWATWSVLSSEPAAPTRPTPTIAPPNPDATPLPTSDAPPQREPAADADAPPEPAVAPPATAADAGAASDREPAEAPPAPAPPTLAIELELTGRGLTNPDAICAFLRGGPWQPEGKGCNEAFVLARIHEALQLELAPVVPGALELPDPRLQLSLVRVRVTTDGVLRARAIADFPETSSPPWPVELAFAHAPERLGDTGDPPEAAGMPIAVDAALFTHPDVCEWSSREGLSICQFYARFVPTLGEALPPGPIWVLERTEWETADTLRAIVRGLVGDREVRRLVVLERDDGLLANWSILEQGESP